MKIFLFLILLYAFFVSIELLGSGFKLLGKDFAESLLATTANPIVGLIIGVLATSLIQSSSTTTSITVGLVAAGGLSLRGAIPIIMGANIGTTITNSIVSMAHINNRKEFKRALAAATVHDFFNILAVIVLFPIEMFFHPIEKLAISLANAIFGIGGMKFMSPLKFATKPTTTALISLIQNPWVLIVLSLLMLFCALFFFVKVMRSLVISKVEVIIDGFLFRNDLTALTLGAVITAIIQSSSITTSLIVPLAGAGILTLRKIYPYTLGANLGTTITALLAAMITMNISALTVALSHIVFNIFGILIFFPLKRLPLALASGFANLAVRSRKTIIIAVGTYFLLYLLPIIYLILR